jgi:hypothetical protein
MPSLSHVVGALLLVPIAGGCAQRDWVVMAVSDASTDVVVRVEYAGGSRDTLVRAGEYNVVASLPEPRPPATITLLDPVSCRILAAGALPDQPTAVGFDDRSASGEMRLGISPKEVGPGSTPDPPDTHCSGSVGP